ncbi:hypothetical protein HMPREF2626_01570 [Aerococcus sp. HMSC062A02]|uniref:capsid assembly scaffolding protein Gp46 family protein n=1 Tax=Aerococcus sp. HMSC062A02 TaxID=1715105 RepID=UPI0008A210F1|nr:DUF4355 domain-containing protein [Aerococcus sp. HMSC062A02]OFN02626.1 hypothetical protein HMPREF2626_01570 [Aerococcus sp. HMSC062A02]
MKKNSILPMDLQFFAAEGHEPEVEEQEINSVEENVDNKEAETQGETTEKLFTQEELDAMITDRLERERQKYEKAKESEKYQAMNNADKVKTLEEQIAEYEAKENHQNMIKVAEEQAELLETQLPGGIIEALVNDDDAEVTKKNIESFTQLYKEALEAEVKRALRGDSPIIAPAANPSKSEGVTAAEARNDRDKAQKVKSNWD